MSKTADIYRMLLDWKKFQYSALQTLEKISQIPVDQHTQQDTKDLNKAQKNLEKACGKIVSLQADFASALDKNPHLSIIGVHLSIREVREIVNFTVTMDQAEAFATKLDSILDRIKNNFDSAELLYLKDQAAFPPQDYEGTDGRVQKASELYSALFRLEIMRSATEEADYTGAVWRIDTETVRKIVPFQTSNASALAKVSATDRDIAISMNYKMANNTTAIVAASKKPGESLEAKVSELFKEVVQERLEKQVLDQTKAADHVKDFESALQEEKPIPTPTPSAKQLITPKLMTPAKSIAESAFSLAAKKVGDAEAPFYAQRARELEKARLLFPVYAKELQQENESQDENWDRGNFRDEPL